VTVTGIEKLSGDATMLTLSPGERAGVRASVNSYSIENVEEPVFHPANFHHGGFDESQN
jgi:hypothetical protein